MNQRVNDLRESLGDIARVLGSYYLLAEKIESVEIVDVQDVHGFYRMNQGKIIHLQMNPGLSESRRFTVRGKTYDHKQSQLAKQLGFGVAYSRLPKFQDGIDIRLDEGSLVPEDPLLRYDEWRRSVGYGVGIASGADNLRKELALALPEFQLNPNIDSSREIFRLAETLVVMRDRD